jgi:tRNA pseudouridine55 synthase
VKVDGRRLHDLARQGIEVERQARPVTVHRFDVAPTADPLVFAVEVECSSGTYVRTLAADLGRALGGGAHLRRLRRTAVGPHTLAEARPLEAVELLPVAAAVAHLPQHVVTDAAHLRLVATGSRVPDVPEQGAVALVDAAGDLLAVFEEGRPSVVLIQPEHLGHQ